MARRSKAEDKLIGAAIILGAIGSLIYGVLTAIYICFAAIGELLASPFGKFDSQTHFGVGLVFVFSTVIAVLWWMHKRKRLRQIQSDRELAEVARLKAEQETNRLRALNESAVDAMPGLEFESYLCALLEHQGYVAELTPPTNDKGVDVIAVRNTERLAVQAKRYKGKVSVSAVQEAVSGCMHYGCTQAMVVTNNYFTEAAKELARTTKCILIDRDKLSDWIQGFQQNHTPQSQGSAASRSVVLSEWLSAASRREASVSSAPADGDNPF